MEPLPGPEELARLGEAVVAGDTPALRLVGLCRTFGDRTVVDHVSLTVPRGSFFGLVGPDGAGKTTTLSMGVGLLRPDAGSAHILGVDVWEDPDRAKALVGVLPDGLFLPERLTGRELLTYTGLLCGLDPGTVARRARELVEVLELDEAARTLLVDCPVGTRKKIGLAVALLHAPRLLVLDEPFEAVDPVSAVTMRAVLRRFVADGGAVVLAGHEVAPVEHLCDHVAVIADGRVVTSGPLEQVRGDRGLGETFVGPVGGRAGGGGRSSWSVS